MGSGADTVSPLVQVGRRPAHLHGQRGPEVRQTLGVGQAVRSVVVQPAGDGVQRDREGDGLGFVGSHGCKRGRDFYFTPATPRAILAGMDQTDTELVALIGGRYERVEVSHYPDALRLRAVVTIRDGPRRGETVQVETHDLRPSFMADLEPGAGVWA
jgi:hypothetical protein